MKRRLALAALLVLVPLSAPRPAVAGPEVPSESALEEARRHFQKGVQLFHEWSFDAALAEFRKAYQLAPSYRVLYNIAQVQYELHNYVDALKAFRQYLNEGAAEVPTDRRTEVEAEIRKLEGRVGYLEITANVEGALASIDEVPVGSLPMRSPILVNPGVRRVSASKAGHGTTARNVTIAGGDHAHVQLDLTEIAPSRVQRDDGKKVGPGVARTELRPERSRTAMWISLAATGALGAGAGVFAVLTQSAKREFEDRLATFPSSKADIDAARSTLVRDAAITDGLAAAAVVAGGFTLVFALSGGGSRNAAVAPTQRRIGFAPTPGGLVAVGEF